MQYTRNLYYHMAFLTVMVLGQDTVDTEVPRNESAATCRSRNGNRTTKDLFSKQSCIACYYYMTPTTWKPNAKIKPEILQDLLNNNSVSMEDMLLDEAVLDSFEGRQGITNWEFCCRNAAQCCSDMLSNTNATEAGWCPRTWDGWLCWPDTPPATSRSEYCPVYTVLGDCTQAKAVKHCDPGGSWRTHPQGNSEWTNYSTCSAKMMVERRLYVSLGAYITSVVTILPALLIFHKYRTLRSQTRVILHKNLLLSLLLHCASEIIFISLFLLDEFQENHTPTVKLNEPRCKVLLVVTKYLRVSNYMWMFCEGFYLHQKILVVFTGEAINAKTFYAIGWGVPILPILVFAGLHLSISDADCWALPAYNIDWALHLPCLLSLLINVLFLVRILIVLVTKIRAVNGDEPEGFRKGLRATLVLVPLFGIHFLLTIYRNRSVCNILEEYYMYLSCLVDGLQGSVVAVIFCYVNSEVVSLLRRSWRTLREEHYLSQLHSTYNGTTMTSVGNSQAAPLNSGYLRNAVSES